jgi:hypothetical protein
VRFPLNKFQKYGAGFKPQKRVRKPPMSSGDIGYVCIYIYLITYNIYKYIRVYMKPSSKCEGNNDEHMPRKV